MRRIQGPAGLAAAGLLCGALFAACSAQADTAPSEPPEPADRVWLTASDRQLDELRGGFNLGDGLIVSFGFSRLTYINDQLVASTSLNLGSITRLTAQQAAILQVPLTSAVQGAAQTQPGVGSQIGPQAQLVQNGPGNSLQPDAVGALLATVIQNSLNDQLLRTQTIINVSSNGLGIMRNFNLQKTLDLALSNAMTGR